MIKFDKSHEILTNVARVISERLPEDKDLTIILDESMGEYNGKFENGVITAGSPAQILEIAGRYLRNPQLKNGEYPSYKPMCGLYLASHNRNYYEKAPLEEIFADIDNLALWGLNAIGVWLDLGQNFVSESGPLISRLKAILKHGKSIGVKSYFTGVANEAYSNSPVELRADWTCGHDGYTRELNAHYHTEICPSKPGGIEKILEYRREFLEAFKDIEVDYYCIFPYDQGGCTCSECKPWGGNGLIRTAEALIPLLKEYWPKTEIIMCTWYFGKFTDGEAEFKGLLKAFEDGRLEGCTYIMAEPQTNTYPYEHEMPLPLIGFPEISMCGIMPWGGYGAIPIPKKQQKLWDNFGEQLQGGFPYCEGYFEDLNKVMILRLYRDNQSTVETIKEYLSYEFGITGELADRVRDAIVDMEETMERIWDTGHRYTIRRPQKIFDIEKVILEAHETLSEEIKNSKKWRLIYYRAVIDAELARNDFYRNDKVLQYFNEMIELYHLQEGSFYVKPDILTDELYGRPLTKEEIKILSLGGNINL